MRRPSPWLTAATDSRRIRVFFALAAAVFPLLGFSAPETPPVVKDPPRSWVDPETGHRVIRITDEPNTESLYFNDNCFHARW